MLMKRMFSMTKFLSFVLIGLFLLAAPQARAFVDPEVIEAAHAVASFKSTPRQEALVFMHNKDLNLLALQGKIPPEVYQRNQSFFEMVNKGFVTDAADKAGLVAKTQTPKPQPKPDSPDTVKPGADTNVKQPGDADFFNPGTDTDIIVEKKPGAPDITEAQIEATEKAYQDKVKDYLKKNGVDPPAGKIETDTDFMPHPDHTTPSEFTKINEGINKRGGTAYENPKAAKVEAQMRPPEGEKIPELDISDTGAYVTEMQDLAKHKISEANRIEAEAAALRDTHPARAQKLDAEAQLLRSQASKYIDRIDKVTDIIIKQNGLPPAMPKPNDSLTEAGAMIGKGRGPQSQPGADVIGDVGTLGVNRGVKDYAETMSKLAAKYPDKAAVAQKQIAEQIKHMSPELRDQYVRKAKDAYTKSGGLDPEGFDKGLKKTVTATAKDYQAKHPPSTPDTPTKPGTPDTPTKPGAPDTSTKPGTPDTPTKPGAPDTSTKPGTPDTPTKPGAPDTPTKPGTPDAPTKPGTPDAPTKPGTPDTPTKPGAPDTPPKPGTPDTPTKPGTPDAATKPGTPDTPAKPGTPDAPTKPVAPDAPTKPVAPDTPTKPGTPDTPTKPGTPDTSTKPVAPDAPTKPGTPDTPAKPGTPDAPTKPVAPDTPTKPGTPDTSTKPVAPDTPPKPGTPDTPPKPVKPGTPDVPAKPGTPDVPGTGAKIINTVGTIMTIADIGNACETIEKYIAGEISGKEAAETLVDTTLTLGLIGAGKKVATSAQTYSEMNKDIRNANKMNVVNYFTQWEIQLRKAGMSADDARRMVAQAMISGDASRLEAEASRLSGEGKEFSVPKLVIDRIEYSATDYGKEVLEQTWETGKGIVVGGYTGIKYIVLAPARVVESWAQGELAEAELEYKSAEQEAWMKAKIFQRLIKSGVSPRDALKAVNDYFSGSDMNTLRDTMRKLAAKRKGYLTSRHQQTDWYCTNRPVIDAPVTLPPIISTAEEKKP
jgi:hypothetical protein